MAAQAIDFSVSGRISRALVVTDTGSSTKAQVKNWGSSGSRVRVKGSSDLANGMTVGGNLEYAAGSSLTLRYAEGYYSGGFGKISIGQGDQGGEGSVYSDKSGVVGIGHGQETGESSLGTYFGSLDGGGGRIERIRYDTPAIGPVSAGISVGRSVVKGGFAVNATTGDIENTPTMDVDQVSAGVSISQSVGDTSFGAKVGTIQMENDTGTISASAGVKLPSGVTVSGAWGKMDGGSDPSFFQSTVGFVLGNTSVGASWYQSSDFANEGSEGTAIGIGAAHGLPKANATIYAAVQNYAVDDPAAGIDRDETVAMIATVVKF